MTKTSNQTAIPRPMNCFLLYRLEKQKEIVAKCAGANHRDISKVIAKWWKNATEEEKKPYREMARLAKLEHFKLYPDYKYMPKKKTTPKRVYVRKNKKNNFTSRLTENNLMMELIYQDRQILQEIDSDVPEIKQEGYGPPLPECNQRSSSESSYGKPTPQLSPYPESFADPEFFSPTMASQPIESSFGYDTQGSIYSVLDTPCINETNACVPQPSLDYLQYSDRDMAYPWYMSSKQCPNTYVNQPPSFVGINTTQPLYNFDFPAEHLNTISLEFIDPSLLLV